MEVETKRGDEPAKMKRKSPTKTYTYKGETLTLKEWAVRLGMEWKVLRSRLDRKWSVEKAFETTGQVRMGPEPKKYSYQGRTQTLDGWAKELGIKPITLRKRISSGWTIEEALGTRVIAEKSQVGKERILHYRGKAQTLSAWAKELGMRKSCLESRLRSGWTVDKALTVPLGGDQEVYTVNGESHTLSGWAKKLGVCTQCLKGRLERGWSIERAVTATASKANLPAKIPFAGEVLSISEWARRTGLSKALISLRLKNHWSIRDALTKGPVSVAPVKIAYRGVSLTPREWEKKTGLSRDAIVARLKKGWSVDKIFSTPSPVRRKGGRSTVAKQA